jgi:hypothetical protein
LFRTPGGEEPSFFSFSYLRRRRTGNGASLQRKRSRSNRIARGRASRAP